MSSVLPALPFVVVDMNTCRSDALMTPLLAAHAREGTSIVLPAAASWELTKGSDGTLPAAMRVIMSRPEALSMARYGFVLRARERENRRSLRMSAIIDHRMTSNMRDVLRGLRDDTHVIDPTTIAAVREHWRRLLDHENVPLVLRRLVGVHQKECPQRVANTIRDALRHGDPEPFNAYLAEAVGRRVSLEKFLRGVGQGSSRGKHLARFPSFQTLHLIGLLAAALRWRVRGGVAGALQARGPKLENEVLDVEYAVLATYGRDYVTVDRGARVVYEATLHVARAIWQRPADRD